MPDDREGGWSHGYYRHETPTLTGEWADHGAQIGNMQDVDLRMFHPGHDYYGEPYASASGSTFLPRDAHEHGDGSHWAHDVDVATPSTATFSNDVAEGYRHLTRISDANLLRPPENRLSLGPPLINTTGRAVAQQPRHALDTTQDAYNHRPTINRSATAPEPRHCLSTVPSPTLPALKRSGTSEDGEDDYNPPPGEDGKMRGRKRQRIPHTAVERRYRENLNTHLDRLRQTVPALAARSGKMCEGGTQEGVKPSKCEILNGAIEHIGVLQEENLGLRDEVKVLKARVDDAFRGHARGSAFDA
ncbi:hypothetical protein B0A50_06861 [Salinomyces thailandicus]|uniref:BHLH domain-containing protein n=1 Tax=Salinomyces thailandicus TaxID=706561 RepID=A0A4U0TPV4_9PEZI|nr:hypothetical protein B0A50_06861 [Salinomyces thailandica]